MEKEYMQFVVHAKPDLPDLNYIGTAPTFRRKRRGKSCSAVAPGRKEKTNKRRIARNSRRNNRKK